MTTIEFEDVSKTFRDHLNRTCVALAGINLRVDEGETVVVVGPSGSGKSTLLRIAAGLEKPTSGLISLGGMVVNDLAPHQRRLAMVFQGAALVAHLTVWENLAFGIRFRNERGWRASFLSGWLSRAGAVKVFSAGDDRASNRSALDISGRIHQVAKRLGLEKLLDRFPEQLSGGERQRVALGRAIVRDPAAFLFDEPLAGLDLRTRQQLLSDLPHQLQLSRATSIWVTHDQTDAHLLADRVAVLISGQLVQCAKPACVYERPSTKSVADFFGPFPVNWIRGSWFAKQSSRFEGRFVDHESRWDWDVRWLSAGDVFAPSRLGITVRGDRNDSNLPSRQIELAIRPEWIDEHSGDCKRQFDLGLSVDLGLVEIVQVHAAEKQDELCKELSAKLNRPQRIGGDDVKPESTKELISCQGWGGLDLGHPGIGNLVRFATCDNKPSRWCGWWFARRNVGVGEKVRLQVNADRMMWFATDSSENLVKVES